MVDLRKTGLDLPEPYAFGTPVSSEDNTLALAVPQPLSVRVTAGRGENIKPSFSDWREFHAG
jgi:hypothetical protein